MDTPTFVLIAIVLATFAVFGPKPKFKREKQQEPFRVERVERVYARTPIALANRHSLYPAERAAARAPSPLQTRAKAAADPPRPRFRVATKNENRDFQEALLPHEFPR